MPPHGDGGDAQQRCDPADWKAVDLGHDDDGAPPRGKGIQRSPDRRSGQEGVLWVLRLVRGIHDRLVTLANGVLAPLITANVDENPHQPRLLAA